MDASVLPPCDYPMALANAEWLRDRIAACVHRAAELQSPVLLRVHVALPALDPWRVLPRLHSHQHAIFAWDAHKRAGLRFVAWGQIQGYVLQGEDAETYRHAQAWCGELLKQVVDVPYEADAAPAIDIPIAVGGCAFDPVMTATRRGWGDWPTSLFSVPEMVMYARQTAHDGISSETALVITALITAHTHADAALDALLAKVHRVHQMVDDVVRTDHDGMGMGMGMDVDVDVDVDVDAHLPMRDSDMVIRSLEDESQWRARVAAAARAVGDGQLDKVVLARAAECMLPYGVRFDRMAILQALRHAQPESICFAMSQPDGRCFVGATPELLVHVSGRHVHTHAVAGTAPRGADAASDAILGENLLRSLKNSDEHHVVAQALEDVLQPLCADLRRADAPQLLKLRRVQHLETPFHGELRRAGGVLGLVERMHPTPSVGGWPKEAARAWLREHEQLDRGWYAGPVGWLTAAGDGAFVVAIRSVLLGERTARAFTGAGIVAASDPHAEWLETELKLRTVLEALRVEGTVCDDGAAQSSRVA